MATDVDKNVESFLTTIKMKRISNYQDDLIEHRYWFPTKAQLESYGVKGIVEYDDPKNDNELRLLGKPMGLILVR